MSAEQSVAVLGLCETLADVCSAFGADNHMLHKPRVGFDYIQAALTDWVGGNPRINVSPRTVRKDKDRIRGCDPGFYAVLVNGDYTIKINYYGGIRAVQDSDWNDTRYTRQHHAKVTEAVADEQTQIGVALSDKSDHEMRITGTASVYEAWFTYVLNRAIMCSTLTNYNVPMDFYDDIGFKQRGFSGAPELRRAPSVLGLRMPFNEPYGLGDMCKNIGVYGRQIAQSITK